MPPFVLECTQKPRVLILLLLIILTLLWKIKYHIKDKWFDAGRGVTSWQGRNLFWIFWGLFRDAGHGTQWVGSGGQWGSHGKWGQEQKSGCRLFQKFQTVVLWGYKVVIFHTISWLLGFWSQYSKLEKFNKPERAFAGKLITWVQFTSLRAEVMAHLFKSLKNKLASSKLS